MRRLAGGIGLTVVEAERFPLRQPRPATLIGGGRVDWLQDLVERHAAEVVIVDAQLTPIQQRNLERAVKAKVIDRTGLILEIFGERARTREGSLQVELAALSYQRSRLVRSWTHLERQRGGLGFMGGPGESQIEIDRRRIDERIVSIRRQLDSVRRTRGLHRKARERVPLPPVALVGYTNAGKSSWFNRLSAADVHAADQLFATLDPTIRARRLPTGERIALSDTVGFISDLPTSLVEAFRATLEEVSGAAVIVHVRDIASPGTEAQRRDVEAVLSDLGIDESQRETRVVELWNKVDQLAPADRERIADLAARSTRIVLGSARTGEGEDALLEAIAARLGARRRRLTVELSASDGAALAAIYRLAAVAGRSDVEDVVTLDLDVEPSLWSRVMATLERANALIVEAEDADVPPQTKA